MDARNGESASRCVVCDVPGKLWVVNISYIDTAKGWPLLVLALSVDLRIMSVIILSVIILTVFFFTKLVLTYRLNVSKSSLPGSRHSRL